MGIRRGSILTPIIADGLVFNFDAANRASTIPSTSTTTTLNTLDTSISGSIITDSTWTDSTISPSFNFDGTDGYIKLPSPLSYLTNVASYSLSFWVYWDGHGANSDQWLFMQANSGNTKRIQLEIFGSDLYYQHVNTNGGFARVDMPQGSWKNLSCIYDSNALSSDKMIVYINGQRATNVQYTEPTSGNTESDYTYSNLGSRSDGYYFIGDVSTMTIYNRALSANEVLHNYNALKSRFGL